MSRSFFMALVAAWFILLAVEGFSQDNENIWTVDAGGKGVITNDDVAAARNSAINDALRNAVEQAVAKLIPGQSLNRKSQVVRDRIFAKSDQYIRDYKINKEGQVQDGYTVDVRAAIFIDSLQDDLHALGLLTDEKNRVQATEVTITVKGLTSCADYTRIRELLKTKAKGVTNVHQREITWGTARLSLEIQGSVRSFTDALTKTGYFSPIIVREENYLEVTFLK